MVKPIEANDSTFEQEVINADKPVLVDFWASRCGPCRMLSPILEEIATEQHDWIKVVKVNIDENHEHAVKFGVTSVPTMVLFKDGQLVDKIVGAMPKRAIADRLARHLGTATEVAKS